MTTDLACPECQYPRIGSRKASCALCNRFVTAVRREVASSLAASHPDEATALRRQAERTVYARLVSNVQ